MRQVLHIFRKDVRMLWPAIAATIALSVVSAWAASRGIEDGASAVAPVFWVLSWLYLVYRAVHQERPSGDREFWMTRPYDWRTLVGAKVLFVVVWIAIPFLLHDLAVLSARGIAPAVGGIAARQVAIAAALLSTAAIAAITPHMAHAAGIAIVVTFVFLFASGTNASWGGLDWVHMSAVIAIAAAASGAAVIWQYARRRTVAVCLVLGCATAVAIAAARARPSDAAVAALEYGAAPGVRLSQQVLNPPDAPYVIVRFDGLPAGTRAEAELVRLSTPEWESDWLAPGDHHPGPVRWYTGGENVGVHLGEAWPIRRQHMRVSVLFTIYRAEAEVTLDEKGRTTIPGVGVCWPVFGGAQPAISCETGPVRGARLRIGSQSMLLDRTGPHLSPVTLARTWAPVVSPYVLAVERPIARVRRDLNIPEAPRQ